MNIDSSFPGGNIIVERVEENDVWLHQDLRDTGADWFYWCFRVTEAAGKSVRFQFTKSAAIGARGPAVSLDHGRTWHWLGLESAGENSFAFTFPAGAGSVLFGMTIPYTTADWDEYLRHAGDSPFLEKGTLCVTRQGRPVETLKAGCVNADPLHRVLIVARHHCCETMASFAMEGLISFILEDPAEGGWLRRHVAFFAIPFMDKDGVEAGDQGKLRKPHDHNRDYNETSIYPETAALRAVLPAWSAGRLHLAFDLHCPWLKGQGSNETLYLVGERDPVIWEQQQHFSTILERVRKGPLPFLAEDNMPFGVDWNTESSFTQGKSFTRWIVEQKEVLLASSIEIPYANARDVEVNPDSARKFGADLCRAIACYLRDGCH